MITVLFFGKLREIAGTSIDLPPVASTDELLDQLRLQYPALAAEKYVVAVDKKTITANTMLNNNSIVALLPPFSGG